MNHSRHTVNTKKKNMWTKFKNFPSNVKTQLLSVLTMTLSCLLGGENAMDRPMVKVKLFGSKKEENFLYDSGAQVSLMSKKIFRKIKVDIRPKKINFNLTCSGVSKCKLKVIGCYFFKFKVLGKDIRHPIFVVDKIPGHQGCWELT